MATSVGVERAESRGATADAMVGGGEQELREKEGDKSDPDSELSLVTSANAVKLILLGDSAVGKTKCAPISLCGVAGLEGRVRAVAARGRSESHIVIDCSVRLGNRRTDPQTWGGSVGSHLNEPAPRINRRWLDRCSR